jgi:ABC-type polysaccharide/polyol phosphate transport system ATPase subunit
VTPAVEVRGVHKAFRIPHELRTTLTERLLGALRPTHYERFEVLRGVDLEVPRGSFVGLIGNNGSGKSTLLKIIAGLLVPDAGNVRVGGSVSALLELGLGFHPELTVRENVELYGAVLGYPRHGLDARVDAAIEFAEITRFRDAKLKNLSTGMQMRLAFATALQASTEIMLLDEILAVGDASFQRKCLDVFAALKTQGSTVLLVSHNLEHVRRFCDHAVLLEAGQVTAAGTPDQVIAGYMEVALAGKRVAHLGDGSVRVRDAWLEDGAGTKLTQVQTGDRLTLVLCVEALSDVHEPALGVLLRDAHTEGYVYAVNTQDLETTIGTLHTGEVLEARLGFVAALRNGRYTLDAVVADRSGTVFHDWVNEVAGFEVTGSICRDGSVDLQGAFAWQRVTSPQGARSSRLMGRAARTGTS